MKCDPKLFVQHSKQRNKGYAFRFTLSRFTGGWGLQISPKIDEISVGFLRRLFGSPGVLWVPLGCQKGPKRGQNGDLGHPENQAKVCNCRHFHTLEGSGAGSFSGPPSGGVLGSVFKGNSAQKCARRVPGGTPEVTKK